MFPFSYTGLRLIHDEKVRDAMERARGSRRTMQVSPLRNALMGIRSRLNIFALIEFLRRWPRALAKGNTHDSR
jgi:hypothetical protein